jgi:hypothetical protein
VQQSSKIENIDFILSPQVYWLEIPIAAEWPDKSPAAGADVLYSPRSMGYLFHAAPSTDANGKSRLMMLDGTEYLVCVKGKRQDGKTLVSDAVAFTASPGAPPIRTVLHASTFECPGYRRMAGEE